MKQDKPKRTLGCRSFPTFFLSSSTHFRFFQVLFWFYVCFSKQFIQKFSLISTWILLLVDLKWINKLIKKNTLEQQPLLKISATPQHWRERGLHLMFLSTVARKQENTLAWGHSGHFCITEIKQSLFKSPLSYLYTQKMLDFLSRSLHSTCNTE